MSTERQVVLNEAAHELEQTKSNIENLFKDVSFTNIRTRIVSNINKDIGYLAALAGSKLDVAAGRTRKPLTHIFGKQVRNVGEEDYSSTLPEITNDVGIDFSAGQSGQSKSKKDRCKVCRKHQG